MVKGWPPRPLCLASGNVTGGASFHLAWDVAAACSAGCSVLKLEANDEQESEYFVGLILNRYPLVRKMCFPLSYNWESRCYVAGPASGIYQARGYGHWLVSSSHLVRVVEDGLGWCRRGQGSAPRAT